MNTTDYKILYAEDDQIDRLAFERFVKNQGLPYQYTLTGSVAETKKILDTEQFDLIIADYNLGDGNAFEIFDHIKNKTPVIFITTMDDTKLVVQAMKLGVYDYLIKDNDRNYLHLLPTTIENAIAHKKANDELMKATKQLEELITVKEQFLANMSHEIRTPMNTILGFTDLILKTGLTTEQKQYTDAVKTSGNNLLVIINDILDFSKIQSGKLVLEQTEFSLSRLILALTNLMLPKSAEKNIHFSAEIDKNIPDHLIGDPTRLNQIFTNLVGNAIKFTNEGEIKITADMLSETEDTVKVKFSVMDTGIGIPENKLSSIFEKFTQASSETTRKYGGSGLGLTIVKQLIELQDGTISVKSEVNKGSSFIFDLKFKKGVLPALKKEKEEDHYEPAALGGLNVLLAEDNLLNQILAKKILTDWKLKVEVAENGLIAIEKLQKNNFDLVLMDIQMPEMDGYETTQFIRKKLPSPKCDIPVIAMTAHALAGEAEKCISAGMNEYISKPFDQKVLYDKMVEVLEKNDSLKQKKIPVKNGNK